MSFIKRYPLPIGLFCLVLISGCLLVAHVRASDMSDSQKVSVLIPSSAALAALAAVPPRPTQLVNGIDFEIASTSAEQEQGLSDRSNVPDNYAMLFVFPEDGQYGFWMKDMEVPLDMIWVTDNGTIASINQNVAADSYPAVFYPPVPIRYVLETRVGLAQEKGWKVGTHISLPLPYGE
jgi:uncharacterized membrane protein (UPF0127 family)